MLDNLIPKHFFAVEAWFDHSIVLTFSYPKEQLEQLIPKCLKLDTFQNQIGFVAVALVKTKHLRPKGFPKFIGNDFYLAGYRIFVRYQNAAGRNLRGLYILGSETDNSKMKFLGNLLTHYNYEHIDIEYLESDNDIKLSSRKSQIDIQLLKTDNPPLPFGSPFADWKEARRFAGPLPFTFSVLPREIMIIEGKRENWIPQPIEVHKAEIGFISRNPLLKGGTLANAFIVKNIPYEWKKGITEGISY